MDRSEVQRYVEDQAPSKHHRSAGAGGERRCDIKSCQSLHRHRSRVTPPRRPFRCVGTGEAPVAAPVFSFRGEMPKAKMAKVSEHREGPRRPDRSSTGDL